jgi:ABC-type multidrug transport system fused ATPase/permease subunit
MLFNDSIINNIRYARLTASNEEIYDACKAAALHDKIMTFPDGERILYNFSIVHRLIIPCRLSHQNW